MPFGKRERQGAIRRRLEAGEKGNNARVKFPAKGSNGPTKLGPRPILDKNGNPTKLGGGLPVRRKAV